MISYIKYYFDKSIELFCKYVIEYFFCAITLFLLPFFKVARKLKFKVLTSKKPRLMFGPYPLINNKYYSLCLKNAGYESTTFMRSFYGKINERKDFDFYYNDFKVYKLGFVKIIGVLFRSLHLYYFFLLSLVRYDVFHFSFHGGFLGETPLKRLEAEIIHWFGGKVVSLAYGADFYVSSRIIEPCWQHTIMAHYPNPARKEMEIQKRVNYWNKHSDAIINGMQIDGLGRWDVLPFRAEVIDIDALPIKEVYSKNNGANGVVTVVHAPNHRFIKGTEYLQKSVEDLKNEGLQVELILIENMQNKDLLELLQKKADILFDQINLGFAMSAIEGFAIGLPVMTNLENREYVRLFRRYSYLNECPAVSIAHENLTENLRKLVTSPELREELGNAGKKYARKYHSFKFGEMMFGRVYDKIWYGKEVDTLNLFHPLLKESYNNSMDLVKHPLINNKIVA